MASNKVFNTHHLQPRAIDALKLALLLIVFHEDARRNVEDSGLENVLEFVVQLHSSILSLNRQLLKGLLKRQAPGWRTLHGRIKSEFVILLHSSFLSSNRLFRYIFFPKVIVRGIRP